MFDQSSPISPQPWSGWPVDWQVPNWGPTGWLQARTSTVGTCCDVIGRTCSLFPARVLRGDIILDPQPLWTTNPEPRLYSNFDEWLKATINSLLLRGEAFLVAMARNAEGFPVRWISLNPDGVTVEFQGGEIGYKLGATTELAPEDVLHIKYQSIPGNLRGIGPLDWVSRNLIAADALAQYGADLAARGGVPWGVLTHPGHLRADQAGEIRDQWIASQAARGGAPAILSGGMTLEALSLSPENMALLSLREFDELRISAAFGVPPSYVNLPQPNGLTYSTAQMIQSHFYWDTLRPMVKNIADSLSGWAHPRGTNVLFDATDYLAPDMAQHVTALIAAIGVGAATPADVRRALGLPADLTPAPQPVGVQG
jgi:HK97 family phage portal protein